MRLRVHQDRGVEEDGEGQVEVERRKSRSRRDAHGWQVDGLKTQEHLEPMRCV